MRYIKYLFLAVIGIALITVALANRGFVTLRLMPEGLGNLFGFTGQIQLPLFIVIFSGIVVGLLIGFVWEWLREHKHRATAARKAREVGQLNREVSRLKEAPGQQDDVLALLEKAENAR